ncbi:Uma2 family endonuclease [Thermoleptolyngbya sp.]
MSVAKDREPAVGQPQLDPPLVVPPGNLSSHEPPLESSLHLQQLILLLTSLNWLWQDRTDYFAAGNLTIYYSPNQRKSEDFRGPDFFVVLGTERRPRKSWTLWEEDGKYPNVIVELLSDSTASVDRGLKKEIYQDTFRTLEYFWFDPVSLEFEGFSLVRGRYEPIVPNEQGRRWSDQLQLFLGVEGEQLRFFRPDGSLVPTPEEAARIEQQRADAERQRADAEQRRGDRLAEKLRELGVDPDLL